MSKTKKAATSYFYVSDCLSIIQFFHLYFFIKDAYMCSSCFWFNYVRIQVPSVHDSNPPSFPYRQLKMIFTGHFALAIILWIVLFLYTSVSILTVIMFQYGISTLFSDPTHLWLPNHYFLLIRNSLSWPSSKILTYV